MDEAVLFETHGDIAVITVNRPERRNALGVAVRAGLRESFERIEAVDKAFCARMDLKEALETGLKFAPRAPGACR